MSDIAVGCCHKCNRGKYTIYTDFVINDYQSLLDDYKDGQLKGSVEQILDDYEMKCVFIPYWWLSTAIPIILHLT